MVEEKCFFLLFLAILTGGEKALGRRLQEGVIEHPPPPPVKWAVVPPYQ